MTVAMRGAFVSRYQPTGFVVGPPAIIFDVRSFPVFRVVVSSLGLSASQKTWGRRRACSLPRGTWPFFRFGRVVGETHAFRGSTFRFVGFPLMGADPSAAVVVGACPSRAVVSLGGVRRRL